MSEGLSYWEELEMKTGELRTRIADLEGERDGLLVRVTELVVRAQKAEELLEQAMPRLPLCQVRVDIRRALAGKEKEKCQ